MDKASIIGDAVAYVHDLQAQARKLKAEVAGLEASLLVSENYQGSINNPKNVQAARNTHPICKKIMQVGLIKEIPDNSKTFQLVFLCTLIGVTFLNACL